MVVGGHFIDLGIHFILFSLLLLLAIIIGLSNNILPAVDSSTNLNSSASQVSSLPNPDEDPEEEAKKKAHRIKIILICVLIVTLCLLSASLLWYFGYFDPSLATKIAALLTQVGVVDADTVAKGLLIMNPTEILTWLRLRDIIDTVEAREILRLLGIPVPAIIVAATVTAPAAIAIVATDPLATVATGIVATGIAATTAAILSAMATATASSTISDAILVEATTLANVVASNFVEVPFTKTLIEASTLAVSAVAATVSIKTASILDAANLEFMTKVMAILEQARVQSVDNAMSTFIGSTVIDPTNFYLLLVLANNLECVNAADFETLLTLIPKMSEQQVAEFMPQLYELCLEWLLKKIMMGWL
jgi:hypothetical protein